MDLDRTRLSAEVMTNWLPKTQGAMRIRPGTKHFGSSLNDTGAYFIEFVASTDDVALLELTHQKMRMWQGSDPHNLSLLGRPKVDTTLTLSDTGWSNTSTGGTVDTQGLDVIPDMTGETTSGVTVTASHVIGLGAEAWRAADDNIDSIWQNAGSNVLPSQWQVEFGSGNSKQVLSYTIRAANNSEWLGFAPSAWTLEGRDTGAWVVEDTQTSQTGWGLAEQRKFTLSDTGTADSWRQWRLNISDVESTTKVVIISEIELFEGVSSIQAEFAGGKLFLDPKAIGARAKASKRVVVDTGDQNAEHSLAIEIDRGPVTLRCGSTTGDDDYVAETALGTGFHNLAFTPTGDFHITVQSDFLGNRTVGSLGIGDSGTVELTTHIAANDLANVRFDQSADVVYVVADNVESHKIERRGAGRSWSFVELNPSNGPFKSATSSTAKLSVSERFGNTTLNSDVPFFTADHAVGSSGALIRLVHEGQSGKWPLGALDAVTDAIRVTGIGDTGTPNTTDTGAHQDSERRIVFNVSGSYQGKVAFERSFDGPSAGFNKASSNFVSKGSVEDTGTFTTIIDDQDDNIEVWYRARLSAHTDTGGVGSAGSAIVEATYRNGSVEGVGRILSFNSNTDVDIEVLSRFSDTGETEVWQEGSWSTQAGYPSSVALHDGRLFFAGGANLFGSVSDDFENFDDTTVGDAGPIIRTLGSGPVDNIYYLLSLVRLIVGTTGSELSVRASSIDEPLTPSNARARPFSTQGSANLRSVTMDSRAIFVQRSKQRLFQVSGGSGLDTLEGSETVELTTLVPDLMSAGVVSIAIQRQPDTRIHCALGNGKVAILTYDVAEDVLAWSLWETNGSVERVMVLPSETEDAVYYHVNRTINGVTKRFLEKWALEAESLGDTGLSWLADCAASYTDTGQATTADSWGHLVGEALVAWSDDTGQTNAGKDLSPDVSGVQTTYTVDTGGGISWTTDQHHVVGGLPYTADYKTTKLAYAAEAGTALAQLKRTDKIAFVLNQTHNNGLFFGSDTGNLDPLPRVTDDGAAVDADKIFTEFDQAAMPFPGLWDGDSRIHLRGKAPRPVTVLAAVPTVATNEKV